MKAQRVLDVLTERARKALVAALDQGDEWGYRCYSSIDENAIMASVGGKYVRWKDLACKGFLTPLGGEVARLARDGKKPAPEL